MNPETIPSLVIITASTATYIIVAAVIGMVFALYCGYRIGKPAKAKPAPKPKTHIKEHTFTSEQTLELAKLWDEMDDGKRLPKVKFWQTVRTMVPKEDNHESMEVDVSGHSRWRAKITKEVEEAPATPKAPLVEKTP